MSKYWFKPHRFGYGATPTTWQGWAFSFAFLLIALPTTVIAAKWLKDSPWQPWGGPILMGVLVLLGAPFLWLCRKKTEGAWRWRWGKDS